MFGGRGRVRVSHRDRDLREKRAVQQSRADARSRVLINDSLLEVQLDSCTNTGYMHQCHVESEVMADRSAQTTVAIADDEFSVDESVTSPGLIRLWPSSGSAVPSLVEVTAPVIVGRDETCGVQLEEESVSRQHAELSATGSCISINDLSSRNGTYIGERRLGEPSVLLPGDLVRFGRCTFLVVDVAARYDRWWSLGNKGPIIGGPAMGQVRRLVQRFGPMLHTVLIAGDTGTGKEVIARELHASSRREGAFVAVNCAAVPDKLFEDQFFGHQRGAFSGAERSSPGLFRAADGGTLFLDEVGELSPPMQPKLLRVLETSEITPLGASEPVRVDVRIVSATNRDLAAAVEAGEFREDLYTRLRVLPLSVTPLRKRLEDVILLAHHFLEDLEVDGLTSDAARALLSYSWSGNARELQNVLVEAAVAALTEGATAIAKRHLRLEITRSDEVPRDSGNGPVPSTNSDRTRAVVAAMRKHRGNVSHASTELGLHRAQIYKVLRQLGFEAESFRDGIKGSNT